MNTSSNFIYTKHTTYNIYTTHDTCSTDITHY